MLLDPNPPATPGVKPEYEKTTYQPEWKIYQAIFNKAVGIDVPASDHSISVETATGDWISVSSYTLTNCRSSHYPPLDIYGQSNGRYSILWAHNADHNWHNVYQHKAIPPITGASTLLHGMQVGTYQVTWWDTTKGVPCGTDTAIATAQGLLLHFPEVASDIAAVILRI